MKKAMRKVNLWSSVAALSLTFVGTLSSQVPSDRQGLLNGEGMGQAAYAENNGYPGPKHVLELADTLKLDAKQRKTVQTLFEGVNERARELGKEIVELEERFLEKFRGGILSEREIRAAAERIGKLRGQLRAAHLTAHLKTKRVLTVEQIRLYKKLRGLNDAPEKHQH